MILKLLNCNQEKTTCYFKMIKSPNNGIKLLYRAGHKRQLLLAKWDGAGQFILCLLCFILLVHAEQSSTRSNLCSGNSRRDPAYTRTCRTAAEDHGSYQQEDRQQTKLDSPMLSNKHCEAWKRRLSSPSSSFLTRGPLAVTQILSSLQKWT